MTTYSGCEYKPYKPGMPIGNYKVRQYKGGGNYIKFGLKDGRNKPADDAETRKRKAQIYGKYKDPLRNKVHVYKRCHSIKIREFEANKEKYNYIYFGGSGKKDDKKKNEDALPPIVPLAAEKSSSSITSHRRTKSDISLPAIAPIAFISRSNSDVQPDTRRRTRKGHGSFYPAPYSGDVGIPKAKAYDSKYKYKHNAYQLKDPYALNNRNFYGFTHSIDKNKPRKRRHSYPRDGEKPKAVPVVAATQSEPEEDIRKQTPSPEPSREPTPLVVRQVTPTPTPAAQPRTPSPAPVLIAAVVAPRKTPTPVLQKSPTPTPASPSPVPLRSPTPVVENVRSPSPQIQEALLVAGGAAVIGGVVAAAAVPKNPTPAPEPELEPEPEAVVPEVPSPEVEAGPPSPSTLQAPIIAPIAVAAAFAAKPAPKKKDPPPVMVKSAAEADTFVLADTVADEESSASKPNTKESLMRSYMSYRYK